MQDQIEARGLVEATLLSCFDDGVLAQLRERRPELFFFNITGTTEIYTGEDMREYVDIADR